MEVFALFGDGSIAEVSCELYGSDDFAGRVFVDDKDVRDSGHKGIWAAHLAMHTKNYFYTAEFKEDKANHSAQGKSAGLAFALKFACEYLQQTSQPQFHNAIAATGEVSGHGGRAKVLRVGHITTKIAAALRLLKAGDLIVYPKDNDPEIDDSLRQRVQQREIRLMPVGTVKEALTAVGIPIRDHWQPGKFKKYVLLSVLAFSVMGILFLWSKTAQVITPLDLVQYGRFSEARNAAILAMKDSTSTGALAESARLLRQLQTPLSVRIAFEFDKANGTAIKQNKLDNVVLSKDDGYRFDITPSSDCFFYAFQFDSNNEVELLFPLTIFSMENHLIHDSTLYGIPASDSYFFLEDSTHQGQLTLYFLASFWRAKDVEEKYQEYEKAAKGGKRARSEELLKRIREREKALKRDIEGLFFWKASFLQERK